MFLGGIERPASIMKCVIKLNTQKNLCIYGDGTRMSMSTISFFAQLDPEFSAYKILSFDL